MHKIQNWKSSITTCISLMILLLSYNNAIAKPNSGDGVSRKFEQIDVLLPTPGDKRTTSGDAGPKYWQQQVDYQINASLDEKALKLTGREIITYTNNSPHTLQYIWLQLDQNRFARHSVDHLTRTVDDKKEMSLFDARRMFLRERFDGGFKIQSVKTTNGASLETMKNGTVMRVNLPAPLTSGGKFRFEIKWSYNLPNAVEFDSRGGYEYFENRDDYIFGLAQWFPRLAAYTDSDGWQIKQFLGSGEFALEFGNYDVRLDVPADHIVASTGVLQNPESTLSPTQQARLVKAKTAKVPNMIVMPNEAMGKKTNTSNKRKVWHFKAENVRDFAMASSRFFIWDAMGVKQDGGADVIAMSFYPQEGHALWSQYSTIAIAHTLNVFSEFSFPYPYPTAQAVNGPIPDSMEYPMISFTTPRPDGDNFETYSDEAKYDMISDIIHETGHFYFPMIVNTDERQWTWMDEGLTTFLEGIAKNSWGSVDPEGLDPGDVIKTENTNDMIEYLAKPGQMPIMTSSDALLDFSENAYDKVDVALTVLREAVLGHERFDEAFRTYAQRWKFKRSTPSDFFRSVEDASGTDLDWFWRGWFYGTDHVDVSLDKVTRTAIDRQESALGDNRKFVYFIDLNNHGGLVGPVVLSIQYKNGTTETLNLPAEVWRYDSDNVTKALVRDRIITSITINPFALTADVDNSNNFWKGRAKVKKLSIHNDEDD